MFGGWNRKYKHKSDVLGCDMTFTVYFPPASEKKAVPVSKEFGCTALPCSLQLM